MIRPAILGKDQVPEASLNSPYRRACRVYGISLGEDELKGFTQVSRSDVPFVTAFEDLVALSTTYARAIVSVSDQGYRVLESFISILTLMTSLVENLSENMVAVDWAVDWEPTQWLSAVLATLDQVCHYQSLA